MLVRDITIRLLRNLGMTTIFGNPGSTELPLFRDFPDDFRYILGLQESVVVAMADGHAQATRNAALVNLHSSAGTGHALGNLFTAYKNQTPLVITAGQQARSILPFEPFLFAERPTEFPQPFVKWAVEPARAADVPRAIARAYYEAMTPPYGPTFVSVPVDDWDREGDEVEHRRIATLNPGDPAAIQDLAAAFRRADRPALVLAAGTSRDEAWTALVQLAEQQLASVYVAPLAGRNVFPETHPLFRGFLPTNREGLVATLSGHDLLVAFGGPMNLYHIEGFGPHIPTDSECWTIGDNPKHLSWAPNGNGILGNTRHVAEQLRHLLEPAERPVPVRRAEPGPTDPAILSVALLMATIAAVLPKDATVVEEAPTSRAAIQDQLRLDRPDCFYTTASGGLGYALPAAVGIALARPDRRVVAIIGDGSAMYAIQALYSAAQVGAAVTFVIVNNGRYEALRTFGHVFGMQHVVGTDLSGLDFCALATGHGVAAERIEQAGNLKDVLMRLFSSDGPNLLEVVVQD